MKFKINNRDWEIEEVSQERILEVNEQDKVKGTKYYGLCVYSEQKIYLDNSLHKQQKKQTLYHELMHCYIGSYLSLQDISYSEESICDISANSHDIIHEIVEKYFKVGD